MPPMAACCKHDGYNLLELAFICIFEKKAIKKT